MARSLLAELVIALRDGVSGPAKKLKDSLKGVEQAVKALNSGNAAAGLNKTTSALDKASQSARMLAAEGTKLADWGSAFQKQLSKMKLGAADIDRLRDSWRALNRELQGTDKAFRATAIGNWKNDVRLWALGIDKANGSMRRFAGSAAAAHREMAVLSGLTRTLGFGGVAYFAQRGARAAATAGADYAQEKWRQEMGGLPAGGREALQAKAMGLSMKYKSVDATDINKVGRALYNMTGDMPKAIDLLESFTRAFVVLQSAKGKEGATKELEDFSKAVDVLGRQEDPATLRKILNTALKATQVEGNQLSLTEYLKLAKYSKSGGAALSPEFLGAVAPTMMQEEGGQRFGTAIGSTVSQMIGGTRMTKRAKQLQMDLGIRTKDNKVVEADGLMSNPYDWAQKHLRPIMQKQGFDPREAGNETKVVEFMSTIFSNQMVANIFTKFFTQFDQIERNRNKLYPAAMGDEAADKAIMKDPYVALEGVMSQLRNTFAILGDAGATETIITVLNALSSGVVSLNKALEGSELAANLLSIAGALVALRGAVALWRVAKGAMSLGAGVAAGAAAGPAAAAAGGAAAGATASRIATFARGASVAGKGLMFVPGLGWVLGAAGLVAGLASGAGDVAPGDLSEQAEIARMQARRWYRPPVAPAVTAEQAGVAGNIGSSGSGQFGLGGFRPRVDVDDFTKADEAAKSTKATLEQLGQTRVKPGVDNSDLERTRQLTQQIIDNLQRIPSLAAAGARQVESQVRTAMRASYSDYGLQETG